MIDQARALLERLFEGRVARGAAAVLGLRVTAIGLGFLLTWSLARILGPSGFGAYAFALSWLALLSILGVLGSEKFVVREIAAARARGEPGRVRGLMIWSASTVLAVSIVLTVLALVVAWGVSSRLESHVVPALVVGIVTVPILALLRLRTSVIIGFERVAVGQLPEWVVRPGLALVFVVGAWLLAGRHLTAVQAVALFGGATAAALGVAEFFLGRTLRDHPEVGAAEPIVDGRLWLRGSLQFLLLGGVYVVLTNTDVVMLGFLADADATGVYRVAVRCAEVLAMVHMAVAIALQPRIASLHAAGESDRIQSLVTLASRAILALTLPVAAVLVLGAALVMSVFGEGFAPGAEVLQVLCVGTTVLAVLGPATTVLAMTGHERDLAVIIAGAALLNIALNVALIPSLDALGAAIAMATATVAWSVACAVQAWRRTGVVVAPW